MTTMLWIIDKDIKGPGYRLQTTIEQYALYEARITLYPFRGYYITMPAPCAHCLWKSRPCGPSQVQGECSRARLLLASLITQFQLCSLFVGILGGLYEVGRVDRVIDEGSPAVLMSHQAMDNA